MKKILFFLFSFIIFSNVNNFANDMTASGFGVFYLQENGSVINVVSNENIYYNFKQKVLQVGKIFNGALFNGNVENNKIKFTTDNTNICFSFVTSENLINVIPYNSSDVTENSKTNISQITIISISTFEDKWQNNKSLQLKTIENIYIDFLTNDWTPILRNNSLISQDYTITVDNTDEQTNIFYLLQLRAIDRDNYYITAGEFDRFKKIIIELGGTMSKIKFHQLD